jgi:hypothetical protein
MQENKKEIQQHYILSRNRSGSTLLNNLLNNHPNIINISELNVYWLLQRDYKNIKNFNSAIIIKLIEDLFFVLEKKGQEYYKYMLPSKEILINSLNNSNRKLDFLTICNIINLQIKATLNEKEEVTHIINKEINFNHLIDEMYHEFPNAKFILLIRNHRANIYSCLKFNSARGNYIYEAKRWFLEMKPFLTTKVPEKNKLILTYEQLILQPDETLKSVQKFLEIDNILELNRFINQISKEDIIKEAEKLSVPKEEIDSFIKNHYGSFSAIDPKKIDEWKYKKAFSENEIAKIDYICKKIALPLGFECSTKKVNFSLKERYYLLLAQVDYLVVSTYITMPIKYKRILSKINYFKFFN